MDTEALPYRPCVGIMVINRDGLVWAGHRVSKSINDPESQGRWWQMPQGGIDADEEPKEAALRELEEETGICSVTVLSVSKVWRRYDFEPDHVHLQRGTIYRGQMQRWVAVAFRGEDDEVDIGPKAGVAPEFTEWRWLPMRQLPELVAAFKRGVYVDVVGEFAHLGAARPIDGELARRP
jgi:putative (di)nucleoside polyphosphate hydrolase